MVFNDDDDVAAINLATTKSKFEALANNTTKHTDTEKRQKKVSVEEMLETQQIEYQKYMQQIMDQQQARHKQQLPTLEQNWRQQSLNTETTIRQKDAELAEMKWTNPDK